ncbi:glutathione transferase GstA [Massilia sp. S19_KUP03_FR1]|uniref:glutathione transferase GstA n=1 Tax=Massilia sp. S19_KUP03_FR1 TaxID=3025503 RepID=UPI002FCDE1E4
MKLYISPGACSLAPHIVLFETGLPFTTERVNLRTKITAGGADFTKINPNGYVPALELKDGTVLTEGPAITQFLADLKPASNLAPANGTLERYQLVSLLNFISTEIHKNFSPLFSPDAGADVQRDRRATLARRFAYLEQELGGKDFLTGDTFSIADAYLYTVLTWASIVKVDLSDFNQLQAYLARVAQRPSVQQAQRAEGSLK